MTFGEYVRQVRERLRAGDRGFSLRQVAQHIGVEPAYLSKIERGDVAPPSEQTIRKLAGELGEDPDMLLAMGGKVSSTQSVSLRRILDLSVTSVLPLRRMLHHAIPDHIQIDVDQTSEKMPACFDRSSMIPIFPECALVGFPAIEFLGRFPCNQLNAFRDHFPSSVNHQKVDVLEVIV